TSILLKNNGLHIAVQVDGEHPVGKTARANVKDVAIESAITSTMACEDPVTAAQADDQTAVYRNWLGIMRGDISTSFKKGNKTSERTFNEDRVYKAANGGEIKLSGRVLMLVRNGGHLMVNNAVLNADGSVGYEGILDGIVTSLIEKHELLGNSKY